MKAALKMKLREKRGDCGVMAMGHCFSDDTEILTENGWLTYDKLEVGAKALTFNVEKEIAEWQPIEAKYVHKNQYSEMLNVQNRMVDFCVTPEHRVIHKVSQALPWRESKACEAMEFSQITIPVSASSGLQDVAISDDWIRLMGWLISEGHFRYNGAVQLFQNVGKHKIIKTILERLSIPFSIYFRKSNGRKFKDPEPASSILRREIQQYFM
jgi:hypothetical protein